MTHILKSALIVPAIIVAVILIIMGYRQLRKQNSGFFVSLVIIALSFMGCSHSNEKKVNPDKIASEKKHHAENKIKKLNQLPEWIAIKNIWNEINEIEQDTNGQRIIQGIYSLSINNQILLQKADSAFLQLTHTSHKNIIDTTEIQLLHQLFTARINGMQQGHICLSHMMSPPALLKRNEVIFDLETRIDMLTQLKQEEIFDAKEYQKNLENIYKIAAKASAYEIVNKHYIYYGFSFQKDSTSNMDIDAIQKQFNAGHEKLASMLSKNQNKDKANQMKEKQDLVNFYFEQLKTKLPFIESAIADFEDTSSNNN